jgi:hypothetical protein
VLPSLRLMANMGYNRGATSATTESTNRIVVGGVNYAVTPELQQRLLMDNPMRLYWPEEER